MWICTRAFHAPKQGNADAEYEDAFYPQSVFRRELADFRCAVADGASESAFAQQWAQILVRSFCRRQMRLTRLGKVWQRLVKGRPLPWYLERKIGHGAHATFLGLSVRDSGVRAANGEQAPEGAHAAAVSAQQWMPQLAALEATPNGHGGRWRALAVGDSCLFHVRGDELLAVGPVSSSQAFDNTPHLLSSRNPGLIKRSADRVTIFEGTWRPKDRFYLATDAMAQWLLREQEADRLPWEFLRALDNEGEVTKPFDQLVKQMRAEHNLHNDDTTLLRVEVE